MGIREAKIENKDMRKTIREWAIKEGMEKVEVNSEGHFNRAWKSDYIWVWQTSSIDHSQDNWLWSGEERP